MERYLKEDKENLISIFERNRSMFPEKTAVCDEMGEWTFSELETVAKKKAAGLLAILEREPFGKQDGQIPIGIVAYHTKETIANMLAIMYSGNFFTAFASDTPAQRKKDIFDNSGMKCYLDGEHIFWKSEKEEKVDGTREEGPWESRGLVREATEEEAVREREILENDIYPGRSCGDADILYLVYTSGSTGIPKGVQKNWGSMKHFCKQYQKTFSLTEKEILGNQTPFYFDAAMKDVFQMLTTGALLVIVPEKLFSFPVKLIEFLNEKKISMIVWVPSALKIVSVLNAFLVVKPETVKKVFFVGEVFERKHLNHWMENLPDAQFVNLYGSSEVAGVCSYYIVEREPGEEHALLLGKGFEEEEVILVGEDGKRIFPEGMRESRGEASENLRESSDGESETAKESRGEASENLRESSDGESETAKESRGEASENLRESSDGESETAKESSDEVDGVSKKGEICVLGKTLADGYYHDEERTRQVFVDNPFPEIASEKMYLSGDLARYDAEGNLVYCGRKDFQIKHMGYRIELQEIELAVEKIPEIVSNACVYDGKKDKIILFYQKKGKEPLTKKDIIAKLIDRLPDYMLPNKVVEVDELPMGANGKIDRQALARRETWKK